MVPSTEAPAFPLGAAANAKSKPVAITFWHSMQSANLTALQDMTRAFNASQPDVSVALVNQDSYTDTLTLYTAALSGGTLPDVVQMETADLQLMIDSQSIVSAQAAIDADHYDLSDFLASTVDYFKVGGVIWAMPFNISSQVLYFDANAFTKAGLDPSHASDDARGSSIRRSEDRVLRHGEVRDEPEAVPFDLRGMAGNGGPAPLEQRQRANVQGDIGRCSTAQRERRSRRTTSRCTPPSSHSRHRPRLTTTSSRSRTALLP